MGRGWPWEDSSGLGEGWTGWGGEGFLFSAPGYGGTDCKHTQTGLGSPQGERRVYTEGGGGKKAVPTLVSPFIYHFSVLKLEITDSSIPYFLTCPPPSPIPAIDIEFNSMSTYPFHVYTHTLQIKSIFRKYAEN